MKVEIRPLNVKRWHGLTGKDSITQPFVLECLPNPRTGRYETGLTPEQAKEYGDKLGIDLTNDVFNPSVPHPFYSTKQGCLTLPFTTLVLDLDNPLDFIRYAFAKKSIYIAASVKDYEEGKYPDATHVIYNEEENVAEQATKVSKKMNAYKMLSEITESHRIAILTVMSDILRDFKYAKGSSIEFVNVEIGKIIEENPDLFLQTVKTPKEELSTHAKLAVALYKNILVRQGTGIYYMSELLGYSMKEVVDYVNNPNNQVVKTAIFSKIND